MARLVIAESKPHCLFCHRSLLSRGKRLAFKNMDVFSTTRNAQTAFKQSAMTALDNLIMTKEGLVVYSTQSDTDFA